ncbi:ISAon1 family transposase N-terminal region protein [Solitalea canadensis]|uniref:ISAon1 family transposase N-terminal region protein n=1 Tax=Solitalea canadensis TaxID=995 RepID=UPI0002471861|nr:transposase [Solitalea canadensis]
MHDSFQALLHLVIPEGVSDYFKLVDHKAEANSIHIYLEELNSIPLEYQSNRLQSKGFFDEVILQDFPLRGREVFLHVKRRRWLNLDSNKVVFRNWEVVAKGTRITQDFAAFLKAISRYQGT